MQIKRDYSQPFFGSRRKKRGFGRLLFIVVVLIGGILLLTLTQFDTLQTVALDIVGMGPTATPLPSDLATRAAAAYLSGDVQGAADLYAQALTMRPEDPDYLYEYGQILIDAGQYEHAKQIADQLQDMVPEDVRGYALGTRALVWMGNDTAALPLGLAGEQLDNSFVPLIAALARAYAGTQNWDSALSYGERAVQLNPLDPEAHRSYAAVLSAAGDAESAIRELEQAIALRPNLVDPYFELAYQYLALNMDNEAIDTYGRILSLQPRNAKALLRQCQAYSKIGQFARAVGFCEDATTADPTYAAAFFQLGMLHYSDRDFANSRDAFQQCVADDPSNVECNYRLGLSLYYLGNCDQSWKILEDSLIMAQSHQTDDATIANIRQGLIAIANDCPGYSVPPFPTEASSTTGAS